LEAPGVAPKCPDPSRPARQTLSARGTVAERETIWREAEGPTITIADARGAEELVNDELDRRFFRDRYEKATEAEAIYMAAMADLGDGRHSSSEIAIHMGMAQKELSVRCAGLIEKGLIYNPIGAELDFTVPQFAAYLRRIHPFDRTQRPSRGRPRGRDVRKTRI
jgi:hypothetical protein